MALLRYVGQIADRVTGDVVWDAERVAGSVSASLVLFGLATVAAGERSRALRRAGAPLLLAGIALLHFRGMAAATLTYDPRRALPEDALPPGVIAPIVAGVSLAPLALAVLGLRMSLAARAQRRRDEERLRELADLALEGQAVCEADAVVTANRSLAQLSGLSPAELAGRPLAALLPRLRITCSDAAPCWSRPSARSGCASCCPTPEPATSSTPIEDPGERAEAPTSAMALLVRLVRVEAEGLHAPMGRSSGGRDLVERVRRVRNPISALIPRCGRVSGGLEGGLQGSPRIREPSFEAAAQHLRMGGMSRGRRSGRRSMSKPAPPVPFASKMLYAARR